LFNNIDGAGYRWSAQLSKQYIKMDKLNFILVLNVPDTAIIHSLLSLISNSVKNVNELLQKARTLEIKLAQETNEDAVFAKVSLNYEGKLISETCESNLWDVALLNALDQVNEKMKQDLELDNK